MNINDFQNLDREAQLAEAGRIAGVEPSVFDGIWRTESGRGANMLSPAGAEGHFGLMPTTRATWEQRFGAAIDPHNFGQSLYTAAHTVKENMGRFKNLPDALRAYNGGWDPAKWGNPETAAYAGKVLGTEDDHMATPEPVPAPRVGDAASLWRTAATGPLPKVPKVGKSPVAGAVEALATAPLRTEFTDISAQSSAIVARQDKEQKRKDDIGVYDVVKAGASAGLLQAGLSLMFRDAEPVDPDFVVPEERLKGRTEQEQTELRAAGSMKELERIIFDQDDAKEQSSIQFEHGIIGGIAGALIGDLPAVAFTGGVTALGFKSAGIGAFALAAQGRKAAAIAQLAGEGVVGEVAYTALLDAMGKHQSAADYAMSVAGGGLLPLLGGKAVGRAADKAEELRIADGIIQNALHQKLKLAEAAQDKLGPKATPDELAAEMKRMEAAGVRADISAPTAAVPDSRRFNVGDEADLEAGPAVAKSDEVIVAESKVLDRTGDVRDMRQSFGHDVATEWEHKAMGDLRLNAMRTREDFQGAWRGVTNGQEFAAAEKLKVGTHRSPEVEALIRTNPDVAKAVSLVEQVQREYLPGAKIVLGTLDDAQSAGAQVMSIGRTHGIGFRTNFSGDDMMHNLMHELGHAIYHQNAPKASPRMLAMIDNDWLDFVTKVVRDKDGSAWDRRLGPTNGFGHRRKGVDPRRLQANAYNLSRDEYMAEQFVQHVQNRMLRGDYGQIDPSIAKSIVNALKQVLAFFTDLLHNGQLKTLDMGPDEFFGEALRVGRMKAAKDVERAAAREGVSAGAAVEASGPVQAVGSTPGADATAFMQDPIAVKYGLSLLPLSTPAERAEAKQILNLYKKADAWAQANPIDEKRLNKILARFKDFDPISNQMLRSENPVVRMVASELLENGGGAAGRRSSAAIAKYMNERAIIGNVINDMDGHFNVWLKGQGGDRVSEFVTGRKRVEFDKLVAEEIEQRRYPGSQVDMGDSVRAAADAIEGSFERARLMQIDAKTVGWAALPETSRGYMPHRMRSDMVRALTNEQRHAVHGALVDQFTGIEGFDAVFADKLASKYLDRVGHRALGGFDAPAGIHQTGASDIVREAMEQMGMTRPEVDAAMKRYIAGGAGHTKKRLDLDLRQTFTNADGSTFRLMDLFDTNMLGLVRGQSQRVSGEVALARHGIMGKPGLAILRRAITQPGGKAQLNEAEAFDAMAAEFLGQPFGTQNKWVDRAMQANAVASLGGMGFNQLAEIINLGMTLGVKRAFSAIGSVSRMRSEIKALARGQSVDNAWLNSIEQAGGAQFGTDAYKMVFPLDNPDAPIHTMGADSLHAADRLLRGAGHLQSKLSLWRAIHSVQQRAVAEEIVKSFAAALHTGKTDVSLADMGLSQDVLDRLRADTGILIRKDGQLMGFDISAATDKDAANQLVQAVHRGASQIIQGTFIGETGKYVHNSYLKLLAQFRNFGLTAVDKQWNRQKGNRGLGAALGMTVGAMGAAAPIYMVRTYLASIGRKDQEEYLDKHLSFGAIARASTNYIATSGLAGDFLDTFTAVTGTGAVTGGRAGTNTTLVGNLVAPALGKVDKVWGAVQDTKDGTDVHGLIKEMPLSRLPMFIPLINALD